jgi:hypothetical protein
MACHDARGARHVPCEAALRIGASRCAACESPRLIQQGVNMKSRIVMAALAVSLFAAAGLASAQQTYYRTANVPGQATPDTWTDPGAAPQTAAMQGQYGDSSYGGTPMSRGESGMTMGTMDSAASKPCTRGPQCNIFFGN